MEKKTQPLLELFRTPAVVLALAACATACEDKTEAEERAEEARDREELLDSAEADSADSAAELRERAGNVPDKKPDPETAEELKDELNLHDEDE